MQGIKKIGHTVSHWEELSMAEDMLFSGESKNIEYKVILFLMPVNLQSDRMLRYRQLRIRQ